MTQTLVDKFDLRTILINGSNTSVFCHKNLGAFRIDKFIDFSKELWSVMIIDQEVMFPVVPVFKNLDEVLGFIFTVSVLRDWQNPLTKEELERIMRPLSQVFTHYNAFPFDIILEKCIPLEDHARFKKQLPLEKDLS